AIKLYWMRRLLVNKSSENTLERELISRDSEFVSFFDSLHVDDRRFVRKRSRITLEKYKLS
ncbi:MAG: hypothetical protein ACJAS1_006381, partial [Oleiphilaceae bacterium]